jgi:hypothetical protein
MKMKIDMNQYREQMPYKYRETRSLDAGSTTGVTLNVDKTFDYLLSRMTYISTTSITNIIPTFEYRLQLNDKVYSNDLIPNQIIRGVMINTSTTPDTYYYTADCEVFNNLVKPELFPSNSQIIYNLKNTTSATISVTIILDGIRLVRDYA